MRVSPTRRRNAQEGERGLGSGVGVGGRAVRERAGRGGRDGRGGAGRAPRGGAGAGRGEGGRDAPGRGWGRGGLRLLT